MSRVQSCPPQSHPLPLLAPFAVVIFSLTASQPPEPTRQAAAPHCVSRQESSLSILLDSTCVAGQQRRISHAPARIHPSGSQLCQVLIFRCDDAAETCFIFISSLRLFSLSVMNLRRPRVLTHLIPAWSILDCLATSPLPPTHRPTAVLTRLLTSTAPFAKACHLCSTLVSCAEMAYLP